MTVPRYQWQPTTADVAERAGISTDEVVRFDHNTSPFPTPWAQEVVVEAGARLNEYPGADYRPIREAAADFVGWRADGIMPGAGVDELILLCGKAFLSPGDRAISVDPTYPLYRIATAQRGADFDTLSLEPPDFSFPGHLTDAVARADLAWLCIPNNPTGNHPHDGWLDDVLDAAPGIVVVDAAYAEFAGDDWAPVVRSRHNVVVLRTLSKGFGLAGARVGYAMADPSLVEALDGVRPPGSISSISVDLAIAALGAPERMRQVVRSIVAERRRLADRLDHLGFRVLPSQTNFLLCEVGDTAPKLAEALLDDGLVVRAYPSSGPLAGHLRFTVRSRPDHDRLLEALERHLP